MNSFSDFAESDQNLQGAKVPILDILGKEIAVLAYRIFPSSKKENTDCMQLQFENEGEICVLFTGSTVLIRQLRQYETHLPFRATIVKKNKYYTLS